MRLRQRLAQECAAARSMSFSRGVTWAICFIVAVFCVYGGGSQKLPLSKLELIIIVGVVLIAIWTLLANQDKLYPRLATGIRVTAIVVGPIIIGTTLWLALTSRY